MKIREYISFIDLYKTRKAFKLSFSDDRVALGFGFTVGPVFESIFGINFLSICHDEYRRNIDVDTVDTALIQRKT